MGMHVFTPGCVRLLIHGGFAKLRVLNVKRSFSSGKDCHLFRKETLCAVTFGAALDFSGAHRTLWNYLVYKPIRPITMAEAWALQHKETALKENMQMTDGFTWSQSGGPLFQFICQYGKGNPESTFPKIPYTLMPQIHGILNIMELEWVDIALWTLNGKSTFRVNQDPIYWDFLYKELYKFWFENVQPGREAYILKSSPESFAPEENKSLADLAVEKSMLASSKAVLTERC